MLTWSSSNNLAFNTAKTKAMLFPTSQTKKLCGFEQDWVEINANEFKLPGKTIDKNLSWNKKTNKHINNTIKNCYATVSVLRKI